MNKETLQNYNERLSTNNTSLNDILEVVSVLPTVTETKLQDKTITITENGELILTPDEDFDGFGTVTLDINISGGGESMNYSLEEQVIGTWVDGRPLYRKTIYITSGWSLGGEVKFNHNIENYNEIWLESAFWKRTDNTYQSIPNAHRYPDAWGTGLFDINEENFTIFIGNQSNLFNVQYIYATFNYTKTTDEPA